MTPRDDDRRQTDRPAGPATGQGSQAHPPETNRPRAGPAAGVGEYGRTPPGTPSPAPPAADTPPQDAPGTNASEASVEHDLEELLSERDEYLELAKRTKADFENFRKRMAADVLAAGERGKADVLRDVLPVLDDLERAIQAAGLDPEGDAEDGFAHGVLLVFRGLREALTKNGVEAVDPRGERFDPNLHEALSTQEAGGAEAGTVVEVMQKGYRLGEYLVRPARVVVAE